MDKSKFIYNKLTRKIFDDMCSELEKSSPKREFIVYPPIPITKEIIEDYFMKSLNNGKKEYAKDGFEEDSICKKTRARYSDRSHQLVKRRMNKRFRKGLKTEIKLNDGRNGL